MKQLYKSIKIEIANELNQKEQKRKRKKEKKRRKGRNKWKGNTKILIQREFIQFIYIRIILELIRRERKREKFIQPTYLKNLFLNQQVYN